MADNVLQTLQHVIQDVIAPDVRELKVRVSSLEEQMKTQYTSLHDQYTSLHDQYSSLDQKMNAQYSSLDQKMNAQYSSLDQKMNAQYNSLRDQQDAQFKVLLAAIGESKARQDLDTYKLISALTERVAALEAARH